MIPFLSNRKRFSDLTEAEILGLAISAEEDDSRIYASYADRLRDEFPATAAIFLFASFVPATVSSIRVNSDRASSVSAIVSMRPIRAVTDKSLTSSKLMLN